MDDVDQAYNSAKKAQKEWSAVNPYQKRDVIRKAADLLEERKDEMIDILVKNTGSTINKATMETNLTIEIIRLAETMPFEMETIQNQSMIPGKKNHVIRKPLGKEAPNKIIENFNTFLEVNLSPASKIFLGFRN